MGSKVLVDKASAFAEIARSAGWEAEISRDGNISTVLAVRDSDGAILSIKWKGEACLNECTIKIGGKVKKLRNRAACERELTGNGGPPAKEDATETENHDMPIDDDETPRFCPEPSWGSANLDVPDAIILSKIVGRRISWVNDRTRSVDTAIVPAKPKHMKIDVSPVTLRRAVTFAGVGEGFRSVYIDRIVSVS